MWLQPYNQWQTFVLYFFMFRIRALMWIWESNNDEAPHCNILQPSTFIRVWKGIIRGLGEVQLLGKLLQLHTSMAGFPLSILQNLMFYGCYGFGEKKKKSAFQLITATANTAGLVELSVQPWVSGKHFLRQNCKGQKAVHRWSSSHVKIHFCILY